MSYIGNTSTTQSFTPAIDYFSGTGSATAFTLSRPVASVAQVQVTIDNVAQNPSSAYTVSGSTITFTSAPLSGTNNIYVYYTSPITQVIAPGQGTVNSTSLASSTGSGAVVLATSPTLVTPALGTPSALVLTNATGLPAAQLTGTQTIPKGTLPTGSVLQVVNATYASETSTTSASYADTGLTVSITPTSSSSKILVLISQRFFANPANGNDGGGNVKVLRGATTLITATRVGLSDSTGAMDNYFTTSYLDSPATTSSITYKTQFAIFGTLGAFITQLSSSPSGITLMEISA